MGLKHDINIMTPTPSSAEIRAAAETAIAARQKAKDAKAAADAAGGADEALNTAYATAESEATGAESHALELSQSLPPGENKEKKKDQLLRRRSFIDKDLRALGVNPTEEQNADDDAEDLDAPMTRREFQEMETAKARNTAQQMAEAISDPLDRAAVLAALPRVVATANPENDFRDAVAIANRERNSKILQEVGRRPATRSTPTGTGAPALQEEPFVPTAYEQMFMTKVGLTKEAILKARASAAKASQ